MKPDIQNKQDIEKIVQNFYNKVKEDEYIGHYFTKVVHVNWEKHATLMTSFWENVLFYTGNYEGNPVNAHKSVHYLKQTTAEHYERWMTLFNNVIDESFEGANANKMKTHAKAIAQIMLSKM